MIDLHIHTTNSDGIFTPTEIIEMSIKQNIKTISFCDHNSIKSYENLIIPDNIEIIKGIEFYANKEGIGGTFHLLGYDYSINNEIIELMKFFSDKRKESTLIKLEEIKKKYNIIINIEDLSGTWLCNKNIMEYLNKKYDEQYSKIIIDFVRSLKIKTDRKKDYKELIQIIRRANGIPVLAHPKSIVCSDIDEFIKDLVNNGLMGIEVYHSSHDYHDIKKYLELANKYNLLISGGSDFHGNYHKNSLGENVILGNSNLSGGIEDVSILKYIRSRK